jgi:hypothetical protein
MGYRGSRPRPFPRMFVVLGSHWSLLLRSQALVQRLGSIMRVLAFWMPSDSSRLGAATTKKKITERNQQPAANNWTNYLYYTHVLHLHPLFATDTADHMMGKGILHV